MSHRHIQKGAESEPVKNLVDPFGRAVTYLRVSLTDRCDLRCTYCMPQRMKFLPRKDLLSLEELERVIQAFIASGVRKVRLTGGEPLIRRDALSLIEKLGQELKTGRLDELTLTTNATQLKRYATALKSAGVRRINVSLDTLEPKLFEQLTRRAVLSNVLEGIDAAQAAGIKIKINTVALASANEHEIPQIIEWAHQRGIDVTLIEVMPLGEVDGDRLDQYVPLSDIRQSLANKWALTPISLNTGGPSRYVRIEETGGVLGFITPLSGNFCDGCNRVRLTCTGRLYMCLGQNDAFDFRDIIRAGASDEKLKDAVAHAIAKKPWGHDFEIRKRHTSPAVPRQMSVTGG